MTDRNKKIDDALESVLLAGGLSFKDIPNEEALNAMREAMIKVMKRSYDKGYDTAWNIMGGKIK